MCIVNVREYEVQGSFPLQVLRRRLALTARFARSTHQQIGLGRHTLRRHTVQLDRHGSWHVDFPSRVLNVSKVLAGDARVVVHARL